MAPGNQQARRDHPGGRRCAFKRQNNIPDYDVCKQGDDWVGKREDASRASVRADTQKAAYDATRDEAARNGGGDISVHGRNGQIRDKNTIAPAKDPRSSKG